MLSRKCSDPSSRTSVSLVEANSIFCRTLAESGTYVTATNRGAVGYRRRRIYRASSGFRRGARRLLRLSAKLDPEELGVRNPKGWIVSPVMVARRPNCASSERRELKSEINSWEAIRQEIGLEGQACGSLD
jgi:hypothetical protein